MKWAFAVSIICVACMTGCSAKNEIKASNGTEIAISFVFRGSSYLIPSGADGVVVAGDQDIPNGTFAYGSVLFPPSGGFDAFTMGDGLKGSLTFFRNQTSFSVSYGYGDSSDSTRTVVCALSSNDPVGRLSTAP